MFYCRLPYFGMTIQPDGSLGICCAQTLDWNFGHISNTDNLLTAWQDHQNIETLRYEDTDDRKLACSMCLHSAKLGEHNRWWELNVRRYDNCSIDDKLRFLEFTTSNVCNQACSTCSSFFSTKWIPLEEEALSFGVPLDKWKTIPYGFDSFGHKHYRMTDQDVKKIYKLLPDLEVLYIKGGEPFADQQNFKIVEELIRVNPNCRVKLTTNMSKVPQKFLNVFKKLNSTVGLSVSIDGIDKTYEYIRSTPFNQTVDNIKRWHDAGIKSYVKVNYIMSAHNFYHTVDFLEWFRNNLLQEINRIDVREMINSPSYVSVLWLFTLSQIARKINEIENLDLCTRRFTIDNLKAKVKRLAADDKKNEKYKKERLNEIKKFHQYTAFLNHTRNMNIYDIHPQLKNL
jgi:organic radical activating enzyme